MPQFLFEIPVRRFLPLLLTTVLLPIAARIAVAQPAAPTSEPKPRPPATAAESTSSALRPQGLERPSFPGDVVYLPGPGGTLVPVPAGKSLEEYLAFTKERNAVEAAPAPAFSLSSVSLEGDADEDRAQLTVTFRIQVQEENVWIRVPLQLNEAVFKETKHQGPGEASFGGVDRETGNRWWLRGKGLHELTVTAIVPIRRQNSTRRLQLSLPSAAASSLLLRVPFRAGSVKVAPDTAWSKTTVQDSQSTIEVRGLGTRFDVSWQPVPTLEPAATALQVQTAISLDLTGDSDVLEANQIIEALQGSFQELRVTAPPGFELLDVEERQGRLASARPASPDNPTEIVVRLSEPTAGPVSLRWILEAALPQPGRAIVVEGFDVVGAVHQSGEIVLNAPEGYRVTRREGEDRYVHRSQVRRPAANGRPATAWRFLKQPFRLSLDVREIEPFYTVDPRLAVRISENQLTLDGKLLIDVAPDRGALQELVVEWPGWNREGWFVQPIDARDAVLLDPSLQEPANGVFRIRLASRKVGAFELPFRAIRPLPALAEPFEFTLPRIRASTPSSASVEISCDEHLEANVRELAAGAPPETAPAEPRFAREWKYRVSNANTKFAVRRIAHQQEVSGTTLVELERRGSQLLVAQKLSLDVRYEPLDQVRLRIPEPLGGRVAVSLADGGTLTALPQAEGTTTSRFSLPSPRIGRLDVVVRFVLELPDNAIQDDASALPLPLVQPAETSIVSTEVRLTPDDELEATAPSDWRIVAADRGGTSWSASGSRSEIPLKFARSATGPSQDFSIVRGWIRTEVDVNGIARTQGTYLIDGSPAPLLVRVPAGVIAGTMAWDGRRLVADRIRKLPDGANEYRLSVPSESAAASHRLVVELQSSDGSPLGLISTSRITCPEFPNASWIQQVAWEVVLPSNQHFLSGARSFSPQCRWEWTRTHFSRTPAAPFDRLERWVSSGGPGVVPQEPASAASNSYVFTRFGATDSIALTTISSPMLVLLGAGTAWVLGIFILKIPALRNVITVLAVGLVVALLCLHDSMAVSLMLQPALVGLVLVVAMVLIEQILGREPQSTVLTIAPASEIGSAGQTPSSLARAAAAIAPEEQPLPRSGSGSGIERPSAAGSVR